MDPSLPVTAVLISPPPQPPEVCGDDKLGRDEPMHQVFGNTLLAELIFRDALFYKREEEFYPSYGYPIVLRKNLRNFRLVSKSWKEAVSKFLQTKKAPLYMVKKSSNMDSFARFLEEHQDDIYSGFSLKMEMKNYNNLRSVLGQCGQHLVDLQLQVPENGGNFPDQQFPALPALQELSLSFKPRHLTVAVERSANNNNEITLMIQTLLEQSCALKHLYIHPFGLIPEFRFVKLPPTLVSLPLIDSGQNPRLLECLARDYLPELKEITLYYGKGDRFPDKDLIFRVFQNLRHSLRVLNIIARIEEESTFRLRFPIMETLKCLYIEGYSEIELESDAVFPALTHVTFLEVSDNVVKQFSSPVPSVRTLDVILVDDSWPIPVDIIKVVHNAFPNLTELSWRHEGIEFEDLRIVFREMRQLKWLDITVFMGEVIETAHWDSLLMGVSLEFVQGLMACDIGTDIEMDIKIKSGHSITMLRELTHLSLSCLGIGCSCDTEPLISNIAFIYAFNEMAKLKHLKLEGRFAVGTPNFQIAKEIVEDWEKQGRRIECTPE